MIKAPKGYNVTVLSVSAIFVLNMTAALSMIHEDWMSTAKEDSFTDPDSTNLELPYLLFFHCLTLQLHFFYNVTGFNQI